MRNIYALCDPDTGEVRYFGGTCRRLAVRLAHHIKDSADGETPVALWIRSLVSAGKKPEVIPVLWHLGNHHDAEHQFINFMRRYHPNLLNVVDQRADPNRGLGEFMTPSERRRYNCETHIETHIREIRARRTAAVG